ncbi:MAG TPA: HTTM domain-containing protein [Cyclobacteriaceae bacterium]|nr:HTTM domain-containing protein [Cyclobacteriaceae bacterium]
MTAISLHSRWVNTLRSAWHEPVAIAPLVVFRIAFGLMMTVSVIRFWSNGWIRAFYIEPEVHFTYFGFEWVTAPGPTGMYALFTVMLASALGIMLGWRYRLSALLFFLSFTYVELIDKTYYLNHYYFVSLMALLLCFVPAHRGFSLDVLRKPSLAAGKVPGWSILIIKLQLAIVYIYAGIAKLNPEWLFDAMPLRIWLPAQSHLPLVGGFLSTEFAAYAFSWMGALYDLTIVFFLVNARTRPVAYLAVIAFHMITWMLFPIGMFPFIMILSTLIFFSPAFHTRLLNGMASILRTGRDAIPQPAATKPFHRTPRAITAFLTVFFVIQVLFPWRYLLYPGDLFWTEQGYRFSWRVMLMEKAGYVVFHVEDPTTGKRWDVVPGDYLTPAQEKMMSTQPDMILQFAHFLAEKYRAQGMVDPVVRAEAYVTLNGRGSQPFIDDRVDLTKERNSFRHKEWIVDLNP